MKSIKNYLNESLLDDDDIYLSKTDDEIIKKYINDNYTITGNLTISKDFTVDCTGGVTVDNKSIESLTNGMFRWGKVKTYFDCGECKNLTSLEGAPKEVGGSFYCDHCDKLETLEGAPEKVNEDFWCNDCNNLKSLEGAPKKVGGDFWCHDCNGLKTLKGAPKKVGGDFWCKQCNNLEITDSDRKKYKLYHPNYN